MYINKSVMANFDDYESFDGHDAGSGAGSSGGGGYGAYASWGGAKNNTFNWTVVRTSLGDVGGTYSSARGPQAAARKAASVRFRGTSATTVTLSLRKKSRAKADQDKILRFEVTRSKLAKPIVLKTHTISYELTVREL